MSLGVLSRPPRFNFLSFLQELVKKKNELSETTKDNDPDRPGTSK